METNPYASPNAPDKIRSAGWRWSRMAFGASIILTIASHACTEISRHHEWGTGRLVISWIGPWITAAIVAWMIGSILAMGSVLTCPGRAQFAALFFSQTPLWLPLVALVKRFAASL